MLPLSKDRLINLDYPVCIIVASGVGMSARDHWCGDLYITQKLPTFRDSEVQETKSVMEVYESSLWWL